MIRRLVAPLSSFLRIGLMAAVAGGAVLSSAPVRAQAPFSMTGNGSDSLTGPPPTFAPQISAPAPFAPAQPAPVGTTPAPFPDTGTGSNAPPSAQTGNGAATSQPFSMDGSAQVAPPASQPGASLPPPVSFGLPGSPPSDAVATENSGAASGGGAITRFVLQRPDVRLTGEIDAVVTTVFLSEREARRSAYFSIGFKNSVVVLPESSRMRVTINGRPVMEVPIRSAEAPQQFQVPIPSGVLSAGPNLVRIEGTMRHRVDCSIKATYELWADLDPTMTGFSFDGGEPGVNGIGDLPSVGVDATGATRIFAVRVGNDDPISVARQLKAAQALGIAGRFEHPVVTNVDKLSDIKPGPGVMAVIVGTAAEIGNATDVGTDSALNQPVDAFLNDGATNIPTLVLSGPGSGDVDTALERLAAVAQRSTELYRQQGEGPWRSPDLLTFYGGESRTLRDLGVPTTEFSGRRFKAEFDIRLPPDFYASAYGNAELRLDAGYSPEVKPGSTITIYINDHVAIVFNLTASHGDLLNQRLIRVPMTHFRPGPNTIRIEANLDTDADLQCLPGSTYTAQERFVLFNTTRLVVPVYARIGVLPNLAALSASAFPYDLDNDQPLPVYVPGGWRASGPASTLIARLAVSRGRSLPIAAASAAAQLDQRSALVVSSASDIDGSLWHRAGLSSFVDAAWISALPKTGDASGIIRDPYQDVLQQVLERRLQNEGPAAAAPNVDGPDSDVPDDTKAIYRRWSEEDSRSLGLPSIMQGLIEWMGRQFGLKVDMLGFGFGVDPPVNLARDTLAVIAENDVSGDGGHDLWTVVTAPNDAALAAGVEGMTAPQTWRTLTGRVGAYQGSSGTVVGFETSNLHYFETLPFSLNNARLIAANWFSMNIVVYAVLLFFVTSLLGALTWLMIVANRGGR